MKTKIKFTARSIYCGGRHFRVLCQIFSLPQDRPTFDGENSAKCKANLLAEH